MESGTDFRIDPITGDYDGTTITHLGNAIYLRITVPLGSYLFDTTLGSKLYTLPGKDLQYKKKLAKQYAQDALQPLIDSKRCERIDITTEWPDDGRLLIAGQVFQAGEMVLEFKHPVAIS